MAQVKKSKDITKLAKELQSPESKVVLDEMTSLTESPEYQRSTPPETQGQLTSAIQAAREMYTKEANKNDWLEVAQTLAGAVAQYGGAQAAGNKYTSTVNPALGNIDYGSRTNRAQKDYLETVRQAEGESGRTRQQWEDTEAQKKGAYTQTYEPLKERLRNAQQIESDAERAKREAGMEAQREGKEAKRNDLAERKLQLDALKDEEGILREQLKHRQTLANQMLQEDLSSKDVKKLEAKYSDIAGKAGLDLPNLQTDLKNTDTKGKLWGTNPDPEARKAVLNAKVLETKNLLDSIASRKKELLGQSAPASVQSPEGKAPPSPEAGAPKRDSQVEQYAKQYKLDYEQAKKVLVGRGYQPKE